MARFALLGRELGYGNEYVKCLMQRGKQKRRKIIHDCKHMCAKCAKNRLICTCEPTLK